MRVLVTGSQGFVGKHLVVQLSEHGHTPICADLPSCQPPGEYPFYPLDILNANALTTVIKDTTPDACVHLGGIAFVPMGWRDPKLTFSVNTVGTLNLLETFRLHAPEARILVVTSGEVYGVAKTDAALTEDAALIPNNLYAASKIAADQAARLYAQHYGMMVMTARPLNHIGPGQSRQFVTSAFASQLNAIASGKHEATMKVGNLETTRNFTDVRDVVNAYRLLLESGTGGHAYNIASDHSVSIGTILETLCRIADVQPDITVDPELYRPTDSSPLLDTSRIESDTGWRPEIDLPTTLKDLYLDITSRQE